MSLARSLTCTLALTLTLACVNGSGKVVTDPPQLETQVGGGVRASELALPMHAAAIVDLGFLEPSEGGRWRLISTDEQGWVRVWQDGKLRTAVLAHHGGATALVQGPDGIPFSAGMDGRVIEWSRDGERIERVLVARGPQGPATAPGQPGQQSPVGRARPIIALTVGREQLAISDGHWVQVWSRGPTPTMLWSHHSRAFVTGLAIARDGSAIAMAMLREDAQRQGLADHPAAPFPESRSSRPPEELAQEHELIRMQARVDHPGATADLVEVHALDDSWDATLEPLAPIDADLAMPEPGLVLYREIYSSEQTRVIGRSIGNRVHLGVRVAIIATTPGPNDYPAPENPGEGLADFAFGRGIEIDQPPIGLRLEPFDSLPIAGRRELAFGNQYWAAGDEHGQLLIGPREGGQLEWLPAVEPIELMAAADHQPYVVTSGLEQPVRIRRWQIAEGTQRLVGMVLPPAPDPETGQLPPALYPVELAIDDSGNRVVVSSWSFSAEESSELRLFDLGAGVSKVIEQVASPSGLSIALAAQGDLLWSWHRGSQARQFMAPDWLVSTTEGLGRPLTAEARWLAFVTPGRRQLVDLQAQRMVQDQKLEVTVASEFVSAIATDGTVAVVTPIGGGTIELLHPTEGVLPSITTFGPVTALAWIPSRSGARDSLLIGQAEGSIELLEPGATEPRPLRPAEGGRVWSLAHVGGSADGFVELDDEGLWVHRLSDGASLSVTLASPEPLVTEALPNPNPVSGPAQGLVVIWRASAGARACRVFDGTTAGVVASEGIQVEHGQPTLLGEFLAGVVACAPASNDPLPIEPVP